MEQQKPQTAQPNKKPSAIPDKLRKDINKMEALMVDLYKEGAVKNTDIQLWNNITMSVNIISSDLEEKTLLTAIPQELQKPWQDWETFRLYKGKSYHSKVERSTAFKKYYELAGQKNETFVNILEWAMAYGYTDIYPRLVAEITPKKTTEKEKTTFKDSPYFDLKRFILSFSNHKDFLSINFVHYYQKLNTWSETNGIQKANWGMVAWDFIERDAKGNKLNVLTVAEREKQTITGDKLKPMWDKVLAFLVDFIPVEEYNSHFIPIKPVSFFRYTLMLKVKDKQQYDVIENYASVLKTLDKFNIHFINYTM